MTGDRAESWRTCIRPRCGVMWLAGPGLDRINRAIYCSEACKRRDASAIQRAVWTELTRRHRAEVAAIRREIVKVRRA